MKRALILALTLSSTAFAASDPEIASIPFNQCEFGQVFVKAHFQTITNQANAAPEAIRLSNEMKSIASAATIPNKPLDEQLSKSDLVKLNVVIQRLNTISANNRLESERGRDLELIYNLWQISENNLKNVKPLTEKDPNYLYQALVGSFSAFFPDFETVKLVLPQSQPLCSLDTSLLRLETLANKRINQLGTTDEGQHKLDVLNEMAARYHVKSLESVKLSPKDKKTFNEIVEHFVKPLGRENVYLENIETLRAIEAASELIYESGKTDLVNSGGDGSKIGMTLNAKINANEVDERTKNGIKLIRLVANKIKPNDVSQDIPLQGK